MKNILIISHAMEIGGAERALLGLLYSIDYTKYKVDLFLCRHDGELLKEIPKDVNLLDTNQSRYLAIPMKLLLKEKAFKMLYGRLKAKILSKNTVKKLGLKPENQVALTYSHKYTYRYMDFINPNKEYDLAISFLTPHYICINKCNAKKKIAWIHTDYSTIDIDVKTELDMWNRFDYIASISDQCTKAFLEKFPTLEDKIIRIDNIVTKDMLEKQSNENIDEMKDDCIKLLSVGRFSYAKNFDNVPEICSEILKSETNVKWYIIGFGGDEQLIKDKIKEYNMQEHVIILGKRSNPYPYIKACDIYLQPSRYEGKAVTVREAQILHKPVIINRFPTSSSQLIDGVDGVIVPMDNKECAKGIIDFINNKGLQSNIINNLKNKDYSNSSEVEKVYKIMEEVS